MNIFSGAEQSAAVFQYLQQSGYAQIVARLVQYVFGEVFCFEFMKRNGVFSLAPSLQSDHFMWGGGFAS